MKFTNTTLKKAVRSWLKNPIKTEAKYGHISNWDVSSVTNMSGLFRSAYSFNQPIGNWDVSNVKNMNRTFYFAESFNQSIENWDVSNVTNMSEMFDGAISYNQPLSGWDVSNVKNMSMMFQCAESFNQPIGNWDISSVTNMSGLFRSAYSFNQPIGNWDVGNVKNMSMMFLYAESFNQSIENWDVSNVMDMSTMFSYAKSFNQSIENWDVSNVKNMSMMFQCAYSFNQPIGNWDVGNVKNMSMMFSYAESFNQSIENWKLPTFKLKKIGLTNESTSKINKILPYKIESEDSIWNSDVRSKQNYINNNPYNYSKPVQDKFFIENTKVENKIKLKYYKNNGADDLKYNPLTGEEVDFLIGKPYDFNAIIEIGEEVFHTNYIVIEHSFDHDLDYIYIGLCDNEFNVKKWIEPDNTKVEYVKKLYLLGEILIDEDLCEACSVRYIDDFDSHDLDDSYDYKKLLKVRENW